MLTDDIRTVGKRVWDGGSQINADSVQWASEGEVNDFLVAET